MDDIFKNQLSENGFDYKRSLDRIIDKYSKLQYCDGGLEVDLKNTENKTLQHYMEQSKAELSKLESKSLTELRDESMRVLDVTAESELHFSLQNSGSDESVFSGVSVSRISVEDGGEVSAAASQLDESQRSVCEADLQPEDRDEQLEMTLRRHGSLLELYPAMISRIERAWRRQHVSEAADSVLRRYRRWRNQPNRSVHLNNTSLALAERRSNKENCVMTSPGRGRGLPMREPILVMDLSGPLETLNTTEIPLNRTFTVSPDESQLSAFPASPARLSFPTPKAPSELTLRSKRLSNAAQSLQADGYLSSASQSPAAKERPDFYGSPVRRSPLKSRVMSGLGGSPIAFHRDPARAASGFTSLSSPQRRPALPQRMFCSQDSARSFQPRPPSPRSASAAGSRHALRRHLSFDSSLPSVQTHCSPKKLDEDFIKLYHKFVCQNKSSFFKRYPCRLCARGSEGSRGGHSSSALAALALSPHRSVLRKRHRELSWDSVPRSKRFRDEYCPSSPGSKRHRMEMLRRRLSTSESEQLHAGLFPRGGGQQRAAEHHQEAWRSPSRHPSAAEFSAHSEPCVERFLPHVLHPTGNSLQRNTASGSPSLLVLVPIQPDFIKSFRGGGADAGDDEKPGHVTAPPGARRQFLFEEVPFK